MSKEFLNPPRGIRDIVGLDAELYEYLMNEFRKTARFHGFKPVIPPTIEYSRLFEAKSGEEIKKSMYVFKDKAGRTLALRPEVTASIIRIYLSKYKGEVKPIRLYYIAQCFRYEEPQLGRYREFWQGGLEIIGDRDINSDISVSLTASDYLDRINCKHYYVVGNVAFHRTILSRANISIDKQDYILHLIDKNIIDKAIEFVKENTSEEYVDLFREVISKPIDKLRDLINDYKKILGDSIEILSSEIERTVTFIDVLKQLGYNTVYEPKLVRGLAYYTGLIYEYRAESSVLKTSIGGGGRYDNLTTVYGGSSEYSTGLALGLDRIALVLTSESNTIEKILTKQNREILIISLENTPLDYSYRVLKTLVKNNIESWIYRTNNISKGLSIANRKKIGLVIIIGEREFRENKVTIKNMESGEQSTIDTVNLITMIEKFLTNRFN
ncbi:MAG: histidine--tRNA ligase [Desulfurococcaceae archaeon]